MGAALGDRQRRRRRPGSRSRKALGAKTLVTSSSDEKLERARELGADATVNHATGDVVAAVKEATGGTASTSSSSTSARRRGQTSLAGGARRRPHRRLRRDDRAEPAGRTAPDLVEAADDLGSTMGTKEDFEGAYELVASGRARPVVDSVFPLAEARAAHERLEAGEQFGKIVLRIPS